MDEELINEKFKGVYSRLDSNFELLHEKLNNIHEQTKKTNGRVTQAEDDIDALEKKVDAAILERNQMIYSHSYNCPNLTTMNECRTKLVKIEEELRDAMFFVRHPKLFIGIISFIVVVTIATFIQNNQWIQSIINPKHQTEQVEK